MRRVLFLFALAALAGSWAWAQEPVWISVEVVPPDGGVVHGAGPYPRGTEVVLEADPAAGYRFAGWEEDGQLISTDRVLVFTAERDRVLVARFVTGAAPLAFTGSWRAELGVLPVLGFQAGRLELSFVQRVNDVPLQLDVHARFRAEGWTGLSLRGRATFGGITARAAVVFSPVDRAYTHAAVGLYGSFDGISWSLRARHYPSGGIPPGPHIQYSLSLYSSPISLTARFSDTAAAGTEFSDLSVHLSTIPPLGEALGIQARASLSLTKEEGFSYLDLYLKDALAFCCGFSMDVEIRFTPTEKEVSVVPRWAGLRGCVSVYGNVDWDDSTHALRAFELYGYRIHCCLECRTCPGGRIPGTYVEFATAFVPEYVPGHFEEGEFEYLAAGFCGPACCGGYWSLEVKAYFGHTGGLFDLSRLLISWDVPLAESWKTFGELEVDIGRNEVLLDVGGELNF